VTPLRVLVVEDEQIARRGLVKLLGALEGIEIAGQCGDGPAAVEAVRAVGPDLVLLDVQMPGLDGFGVIEAVGVDRMPPTVFVTAFEEHTLRAFDVHAVDYLLKPVDAGKLARAIRRARQRLASRVDLEARLTAVLADLRRPPAQPERFTVKSAGRVVFVRTADIDWIGAADNYAELHVGSATHLLHETLSALEARLDPQRFIRVHRSRIINVDRVRELRSLSHGEYEVILHDGTRLLSARGYRERLRRLIGDS